MVAAYAGGMVAVDVVNQFVARVYEAHVADTRDSGVAAALGGMCSGLQRAGHSSVSELGQKLATTWMEGLSREVCYLGLVVFKSHPITLVHRSMLLFRIGMKVVLH